MKDVESGLSIPRYYAMHSIRWQKGAFQKLPPGSKESIQRPLYYSLVAGLGVVQSNCTEKSPRSSSLRLELQKRNKTRVEQRWKMSLPKGSGTGHSFHPQVSEPEPDNRVVGFLSEAGTQPDKLEACSLSVRTAKLCGRMDPPVALWLLYAEATFSVNNEA